MGHLLTAGVIHHRMTGQDNLLNVARRAGDFLCANVGVTVKPYMAHNPSAIMGLGGTVPPHRREEVSRVRPTHRGPPGREPDEASPWATINPASKAPISSRTACRCAIEEVVGHNVFFTYLYTGAGDLVAESGEASLATALGRLWTDLTQRKMFIHGGVSAIPQALSQQHAS